MGRPGPQSPTSLYVSHGRGVPIGGTVRTSRAGRSRGHGCLAGRRAPPGRARALPGPGQRHRRRGRPTTRADGNPRPCPPRRDRRPARARDDPSRPRQASSRTVTAEALAPSRPSGDEDRPIPLRHGPQPDRTPGPRGDRVIIQSRSERPDVPAASQTDARGGSAPGRSSTRAGGNSRWSVRADGFAPFAQMLLVPAEVPPQLVRLSPRRPIARPGGQRPGSARPGSGRPVGHGIRLRRLGLGGRGRRRRPVHLVRGPGHRQLSISTL